MKLYGFPPSPNTWKVLALAHEIGTPLDLQLVDLTKGAQRAPEYLALNPCGRAPVLVDGDFTLWESNAILQYIAAKAGSPLYPDDLRIRADIARWQSWHLAHWHAAVAPMIVENIVKPVVLKAGEPDAKVLAVATEAFHREAPTLDAHLGRHPWLAGDALTIADFTVVSPLFYAEPAKMPVAPYANISRWFGRLAAMPSWRSTAPALPAAA